MLDGEAYCLTTYCVLSRDTRTARNGSIRANGFNAMRPPQNASQFLILITEFGTSFYISHLRLELQR